MTCVIRYMHYAEEVRYEYAHVPVAQFQEGRGKFMRDFLKHDTLYFTEEMRTLYEVCPR